MKAIRLSSGPRGEAPRYDDSPADGEETDERGYNDDKGDGRKPAPHCERSMKMAREKDVKPEEKDVKPEGMPPDVENTLVTVKLERERPGEDNKLFVSDGRRNWMISRGVEVDVPYAVFERLRDSEDAKLLAYRFEKSTSERTAQF